MSFNPYQPPTRESDGSPEFSSASPEAVVTPRIIESLRKTRPWVLLMAILGMMGAGMTFLGGLGFLVSAPPEMPAGIGLFYFVMGGVYLVPTIMLFKYGTAINRLIYGGGVFALEEALDAQRRFWQFTGIMLIVGVVLSMLAAVLMVMAFAALGNMF